MILVINDIHNYYEKVVLARTTSLFEENLCSDFDLMLSTPQGMKAKAVGDVNNYA